MRGTDEKQAGMFSYLSPEQRIPADHPLRPMRASRDRRYGGLQTPAPTPRLAETSLSSTLQISRKGSKGRSVRLSSDWRLTASAARRRAFSRRRSRPTARSSALRP
jgi:hypothetical protein